MLGHKISILNQLPSNWNWVMEAYVNLKSLFVKFNFCLAICGRCKTNTWLSLILWNLLQINLKYLLLIHNNNNNNIICYIDLVYCGGLSFFSLVYKDLMILLVHTDHWFTLITNQISLLKSLNPRFDIFKFHIFQ